MNGNYYYLRKTDKNGDRALYKHKYLSRFYRSDYPIPHEKCFKLYTAKKLLTILRQRKSLHDYCNEWFDVYNQDDEKVDWRNEL